MKIFHDSHRPTMAPSAESDSGLDRMIRLGVAAWGSVRFSLAELERYRKAPPEHFPAPVTPAFLKHSDEQTIASIGAVAAAIRDFSWSMDEFQTWSIVAAPRFLGRTILAAGMHKYESDGPWGVSVQAIPHRSQHSVASTLSLALGARGPCIGAGSGRGGDIEALLASVTLLSSNRSSGCWLVMSGWHPELQINREGKPISDSACSAVAMALVVDGRDCHGELRLNAAPRQEPTRPEHGLLDTLADLFDHTAGMPLREASVVGDSNVGLHWELDLRVKQAVSATPPAVVV